ncbi:MAG: tryptophan 2,3-dioxygenase family protein [Bacteroidia bacterium]
MDLKSETIERLKKLDEKFQAMGQDMNSYLDGLLHADYLTYWDYIHLDTLLSLQTPKTSFPDEQIFIMYHQITELYFRLCMVEFEQLCEKSPMDTAFFISRLGRINRYFEALITSFDIMVDGMDVAQFLKFRMSLLPASGFQSGQYRMIEICSTNFVNLISPQHAKNYSGVVTDSMIESMYEHIYWKAGATELASGKKTLTLEQFEKKYSGAFINLARKFRKKNLNELYHSLPEADQKKEELIHALKQLDVSVNINWKLCHYRSAVRYLQKDPEDIKATGGTNWQKYLPPRFQKLCFFPELWTKDDMDNWGKNWVKKNVFNL